MAHTVHVVEIICLLFFLLADLIIATTTKQTHHHQVQKRDINLTEDLLVSHAAATITEVKNNHLYNNNNNNNKGSDTTLRIRTTHSTVSTNVALNSGGRPKFQKEPTHLEIATTTTSRNTTEPSTSNSTHFSKAPSVSSHRENKSNIHPSSVKSNAQPHISPRGRHSLDPQNKHQIEIITQALYNYDSSTNTLDMLDSSSSALGSDNLLDVDGLDKIHVRLKLTDVIMLVCGTVAGTVTLCILVSFMSCCCKKKRKQSEQSDSETNGNTKYNTSDKQKEGKQGPDILEVAVETRQRGGNGEEQDRSEQKGSVKSHKSNDKFSSLTRQQKVISVKDRIRVFETKPQPDSSKSEDSKPKRKKPKSKAFEDFENSGILIGFGNAPRKRTETEQDGDTEGEEDGENVSQSGSEDHRVALPYLQSSTDRSLDSDSIRADSDSGNIHNYSFFREDDEGIHTMDSDDDDFDRVTRDTEILKSFRKPPPPKNRGRVKRSFKKEGHHPIHSGASRQMTNMDESDESASDRNTPVSQILKNVGEPARLSPSPLTFQQSSFLESDQNQVKSHKSKQLSSNSTNSSPMLPRDLTNEGNENAVLLPKTQTGKHKLLITADSNTPDGSTAKQRHTVFDVNLHKRAKQIGPATRPHSYHDELDTPNERTRLYGQNSSSEITEQINDQPNLSPTDMRRSKSDYTTFPSSSAQISVATIRDLTQNREKETSDPRAQAYTNYAYEPVMYPNSEKLERKNIVRDGLPPRYPKTDKPSRKFSSKKKTESSKDGE